MKKKIGFVAMFWMAVFVFSGVAFAADDLADKLSLEGAIKKSKDDDEKNAQMLLEKCAIFAQAERLDEALGCLGEYERYVGHVNVRKYPIDYFSLKRSTLIKSALESHAKAQELLGRGEFAAAERKIYRRNILLDMAGDLK